MCVCRMRAWLCTLMLVVCVPAWPAPARAFAPDGPDELPGVREPIVPRTEATAMTTALHIPLREPLDEVPIPTAIQQIGERLREIPLRPVSIGEAPRRPDDPEPGAGVTVFIRF